MTKREKQNIELLKDNMNVLKYEFIIQTMDLRSDINEIFDKGMKDLERNILENVDKWEYIHYKKSLQLFYENIQQCLQCYQENYKRDFDSICSNFMEPMEKCLEDIVGKTVKHQRKRGRPEKFGESEILKLCMLYKELGSVKLVVDRMAQLGINISNKQARNILEKNGLYKTRKRKKY